MRGSVLVFQGTMLAVTINHYVIYQRFQLKYFLIQILETHESDLSLPSLTHGISAQFMFSPDPDPHSGDRDR